jgi:proteasome lid subunit RPN8/RPN11
MPIHLTTQHIAAINAHGEETFPHECCGFMLGKLAGDDDATVAKLVRAENTRHDSLRNRFEIDPGEFMRTDKAARAEKLDIVGFYHSHPDAPARPSEYDRERAWPGYCYVITSIISGKAADLTNWRLAEDRSGFIKDEIVTETVNEIATEEHN